MEKNKKWGFFFTCTVQAVNQEEPSDRKQDPWPLWMAGHAQLNLSWRNARRHKFAWRGPFFLPGHEKMCLMSYANNKGADQPAHPCSLISAFVVRCLDSVMSLVSVTKISSLMLAPVAEQASLSLTGSETPKDKFHFSCIHLLQWLYWAASWQKVLTTKSENLQIMQIF